MWSCAVPLYTKTIYGIFNYMKIAVRAKPGAQENNVEKIDDGHYVVSVTEPPIQGRANRAIVIALADYFNAAPSSIRLISGFTSREKLFEISGR